MLGMHWSYSKFLGYISEKNLVFYSRYNVYVMLSYWLWKVEALVRKKYILYFVFELIITSAAGETEFSLAYLLIFFLTDWCIACLMNMTQYVARIPESAEQIFITLKQTMLILFSPSLKEPVYLIHRPMIKMNTQDPCVGMCHCVFTSFL